MEKKTYNFIDRTGEKKVTKKGYNTEIIKYEHANNCTIKFIDTGEILYNKSYSQFIGGTLKRPINRIGEKHLMNDGHEVTIVKYENTKKLVIEYSDGTQVSNRDYYDVLQGSIMKPQGRVGEVHMTNQGYPAKIIKYFSAINCTIEFDKDQIVENVIYGSLIRGSVDNPYHKSVYGVGYVGVGKYNSTDTPLIYNRWSGIILRCYNEKHREANITYKDVTVCKEWKCLQNFGAWFEDNWKPWMDRFWDTDKDILIKGNKIYSVETCCFVPQEINALFVKSNKTRGKYPIGVSFDKQKKKFLAQLRRDNLSPFLGYHDTPEEAFYAYKEAKEEHIKRVADKWKDKIHPKVYTAMYNYQVEITD